MYARRWGLLSTEWKQLKQVKYFNYLSSLLLREQNHNKKPNENILWTVQRGDLNGMFYNKSVNGEQFYTLENQLFTFY